MKKIMFLMSIVCYLFACNFSDELIKLSKGWLYVSEGKRQKVIDGGEIFVPCEVTGYEYDDDFIVASQRPTSECFLGKDTFEYKQGKDSTYYWLIIHKSNELLGPLTKEEYLKVRMKYNVPKRLELRPHIDE